MTDYPIGTVADIVTKDGHTGRAIRRPAWWACACGEGHLDGGVTHVRPLLVLDPEELPSAKQVRHASSWAWASHLTPLLTHLANALDALPPATEPEPTTALALLDRLEAAEAAVERVQKLAESNGVWKGEKHVRLTRRDPDLGCEVTESYVRLNELLAALDGEPDGGE